MVLILAVGILALLGYQVFTGLVFQKIGFGPLSIELGIRTPQPSETAAPVPQSPTATATREFVVGRWQLAADRELELDFFQDGSMSGWEPGNTSGQLRQVSGRWKFTRVDDYNFHLYVEFDSVEKPVANYDFGIRDHDHIHEFQAQVPQEPSQGYIKDMMKQIWVRVAQ